MLAEVSVLLIYIYIINYITLRPITLRRPQTSRYADFLLCVAHGGLYLLIDCFVANRVGCVCEKSELFFCMDEMSWKLLQVRVWV